MTYRTISVFEKPNVIVENELWTSPGWAQFVALFLYDGNPYIQRLEKFENEDRSYLEYHLDFFDENAYHMWYDEWSSVHDVLRPQLFENLRATGTTITTYWEGEFLGGGEDVLPISEFVSKLT